MNYQETINYLFQKLPIYQRVGGLAYKKDIGNILEACETIGNPHLEFQSVHIAGTNGKGSTAHMISSILQESGYNIGLYTSPHLKDFRERIKINGKMISKKFITNFIKNNKKIFENINMSFFEMTVAMAFKYFHQRKVDLAIIETGLGGRLDSTNIIKPIVSVITNIGLDHQELLGNTIQKIAKEKAGIIKKSVPVIIGRYQKECSEIFTKRSKELNSEIIFCNKIKKYKTDLCGNYQIENISTAIHTINILKRNMKISNHHISNGLLNVIKNTSFKGRWQIIETKPLTICDIAHNIDGIKKVLHELKKIEYNRLHIIIGTVDDKDVGNMLSILPKDAIYYFCEANIPRSLKKENLKKEAGYHGLYGEVYNNVKEALILSQRSAKEQDCIIITGSTFIVAEII